MKAKCTAAQLHQDVVQVIQQLVAIGKLLQMQTKKIRKKVTGEGKGTCNELLSYWCWMH